MIAINPPALIESEKLTKGCIKDRQMIMIASILGDDELYMREAIRVAVENGSDPSLSPIGCVIVLNGKILAARRNKVAEHHDAVAHAEIEATHGCMTTRGVHKHGSGMVTSRMLGCFRDNPATRHEFMVGLNI